MTRPGGVPAAWSSGDPTIATSGATFVVGQQWGTWDGALAVATLKGVSLHLFSVNSANATARAAAPAQPVREATSTVIEAKDVTTGDSPAADGEAATAPADATARGSADPIGTGLEGVFGRLRTAQLGPDGALYLTTSNDNNQDKILRVQASRRRTPPADNPTPSGVALLRTEVATTAFVRGTDDAVWFRGPIDRWDTTRSGVPSNSVPLPSHRPGTCSMSLPSERTVVSTTSPVRPAGRGPDGKAWAAS